MKYLEYPELELLSRALTFESAECKVFTRMEAYSCKTVTKEKRLFKTLESSYLRSASTSPPDYLDEMLTSPFGRLDQPAARKTLFLLIATLNVAFPDHDFSEVNPADFKREISPAMVLNSLSTTLLNLKTSNAPRTYSSFPGSFEESTFVPGGASEGGFSFGPGATSTLNLPPLITHPALSSILDDIMKVSDCEVFTFHPDMDSDPHASADPEEEGEFGEDDPYDDGHGYWDEGDTDMRDQEGTPRVRDLDDDMVDTPMFDEDVYDGGFGGDADGNASATSMSSGLRTPGHHNVSLPSSSYMNAKSRLSMMSSSLTSYSSYNDAPNFDKDDDLDGTGAGLLWSTFAFFYNRKMKRIMFVSVWSRKNSRFGLPTSSWAYNQPVPTLSSSLSSPPPPPRGQTGPGSAKKAVTPAKRAIARTDSTGSIKGRRSRAASGSPAPSSLSPFPHASPRAPPRTQNVLASKAAGTATKFASLDATLLSASAPATATSRLAKSSTTAGGSKRSSDAASGTIDQKRAKKQSA